MAYHKDFCPLYKEMGAHWKVVAIDFDDTLVHGQFPDIGGPMPGIVTRMHRLNDDGCRIIIHTSRISPTYQGQREKQRNIIAAALDEYGIPWHEIWEGVGKPLACVYVDDKGYKSLTAFIYELDWREKIGSGHASRRQQGSQYTEECK